MNSSPVPRVRDEKRNLGERDSRCPLREKRNPPGPSVPGNLSASHEAGYILAQAGLKILRRQSRAGVERTVAVERHAADQFPQRGADVDLGLKIQRAARPRPASE